MEKLREWLDKNNARFLRRVFDLDGTSYRMYTVNGKIIVIIRYTDTKTGECLGWESYVPACERNDISAELEALNKYVQQ